MGTLRRILATTVLLTALVTGAIAGPTVHAAGPYVVNSINDTDDANTADGICQTSVAGECTLRAAIQQANADASPTNTTISFNIPGGGVHTITTTRSPDAFPVALVPITINGTTQSGWIAATAIAPATLVIELDCRGSTFNCLQLRGATSVVKGLTINHAGTAIIVGNSLSPPTTVVSSVITGNHLGTNPAGTATSPLLKTDPNANQHGILIGNGTVTIGGTNPADRNVITGFGNYGILTDPTAGTVTVQGNYIGTNATGTAAISPFWPPDGIQFASGVIIQSAGTIGGPSGTMRNIISGWPNVGLTIASGNIFGPHNHSLVTVQNNYIGTDVTGTAKVENLAGIGVTDADNVQIIGNVISANVGAGIDTYASAVAHPTVKGNIIGPQKDGVTAIPTAIQPYGIIVEKGSVQVGGTTAGDGNIIAFNDDPTGPTPPPAGVYVSAGTSGTTILGNSIFSNSQSHTRSGDGITVEPGANNNQAAPTITSAATGSGMTTILGTLTSAVSTTYRLEFFANTTTDAPGISEGETYAGTINVTTGSGGTVAINTTAISIPVGKYVTATATDTSANNTSQFSNALIVSTAANQPPSFTKGVDQTVNEDAGAQTVPAWATNISQGAGESGQTVHFNVTNNTNTGLFATGPAISATGDLTYTPATNANGTATITITLQDDGGVANGGQDTSPAQTFVITVNAVNDPPSFTKGADQTVNENAGAQTVPAWATAILAGPPDEVTAGQTVTFNITNNTNAGLFAVAPAISPTGDLTYTPAANVVGSATITITLSDSGSNVAPNANTSPSQTFIITVNAVNQPPSFIKGPDQTVNEDAGAQSIANWATAISQGAGDSGQTVAFNVTNNTNPTLFAVAPAISPTGTLTYTPAPDANGTATITITLSDNGSNVAPNVNTSPPQTFVITVNAVNDRPTFTKGTDQTVGINAGAQTVANWATAISPGPPNESGQTLTFQVTNNTNPGLFAVAPAVSATGTLTYTPATNVVGTTTVTLVLMDNGGTANGGQDTSTPPQTFVITVNGNIPVAQPDSYSTTVSTPLTVAAPGVLANDTGTPAPTAVKVADPAHGTLALAADGSFVYTPTAGYVGPDSFTYTATNGSGNSAVTTVTLAVIGVQAITVTCGPGATIPVAGTGQCTTTATYTNGTTQPVTTATYTSSNPAAATVDPVTGTITASRTPGTTTITATVTTPSGTFTSTITVTVHPPAVTGVVPPPAPSGRPVTGTSTAPSPLPAPAPTGR